MSDAAVKVLICQLGEILIAVELNFISSVLSRDDAASMDHLDPRPHLLGIDDRHAQEDDLPSFSAVGLLDRPGPPTVVILGEVLGMTNLTVNDLLKVSPWAAAFLPPLLQPACARWEQNIVWLLDLDTLTVASSL